MYKRYCTICGKNFETNIGSVMVCSDECGRTFDNQSWNSIGETLEEFTPKALEILGFSSLEEYQANKEMVRESRERYGNGNVYFIQSEDGMIKIGFSEDVDKRMKALQTSTHQKLKLIKSVGGDLNREKSFHKLFENLRISGEWFRPDQELVDFISELQ